MSMNTFDTRRKPMRKFVILAGVVILVVVGCLIMTLQGNTKDHIKVGIRSDATGAYDSDGMNITWVSKMKVPTKFALIREKLHRLR